MVDPDNEERLLKIPPHVAEKIEFEERRRIRKIIIGQWFDWTGGDICVTDPCSDCVTFINLLREIGEQ